MSWGTGYGALGSLKWPKVDSMGICFLLFAGHWLLSWMPHGLYKDKNGSHMAIHEYDRPSVLYMSVEIILGQERLQMNKAGGTGFERARSN